MQPQNLLVKAASELAAQADKLRFSAPVAYVHNPLIYAWDPHEIYLRRFGAAPQTLFRPCRS